MLVSDILEEAKEILGRCDNPTIFKRLTDAVRLANAQIVDGPNQGIIDLCVCNGCVTLPADVGTVLACNVGGHPSVIRDEWFAFNVSGPGNTDWVPWGYADEVGQVCTFRDPSGPVQLIAQVESALDSNKNLRVFGWDVDGKRIYTPGLGGVLEDGFQVPMVYGYAIPSPVAPAIARFDNHIVKAVTNGFVKLIAINADGSAHTLIGYYQPWETNPTYRRVRVPKRSWIRIKYRKNDLEVRGLQDWINLENREAITMLLKAVKYRRENQFQLALSAEQEGIRLLKNDLKSNNPPSMDVPQIIDNSYPDGPERLFY